jgi:phosphoglycolate phosphatase
MYFTDVDGTLIESVGKESNALHKEAFQAAFKDVFGIDTHIDVVKHHGATDPLVLLKVLVEGHGKDKVEVMEKMDAMEKCMLQYYEAHKERCGLGLSLLPHESCQWPAHRSIL